MTISISQARSFIQCSLDGDQLTDLCREYFPTVFDDFTTGMTKTQRLRLLIEHVRRQGMEIELAAALGREQPQLYREQFGEPPIAAVGLAPTTSRPKRDPNQIFIAHAHQDAEFARRLMIDLRQQGFKVWIAPDSIKPGERWVEGINRGLDESGVLVLAVTPAAVKSRWVTSEAHVAIGLEHERKMRFLPLDVMAAEMPSLWRSYQFVDFQCSYDAGLTALLRALRSKEVEPASSSDTEQEAGKGGFADFFNSMFGDLGAQGRTGRNLELTVEVTLEEAYNGTARTLEYESGERATVKIPPGVKTGSRIRLRGKGAQGSTGPGDLFLKINVRSHLRFTRQGDHLHLDLPVAASIATLGGKVRVDTLTHSVNLTIPPGTQNGRTFRLKGLGMPKLRQNDEHGDLLVSVHIQESSAA